MTPQSSILIVEDEPDIMQILTHALSAAGYRVVQAYGGEDALRKVRSQQINLVLTDLAMPQMSGVELIHDIKNDPRTKHIPVVAVTAHVWNEIAQSAGQVGCDGFISKPFDTRKLVREVGKYLKSPSAD